MARAGVNAVAGAAPLVQCMTNIVVAGFTANVLLAIGASPAMVENAEESADMAAVASCLLVNLGTLSGERQRAMLAATASARAAGTPWVLDPVAVGALAPRTELARRLLESRPAVIRGNASEVISLAGVAGFGGRGVDSRARPEEAVEPARELAAQHATVVAVSGPVDYVTDGAEVVEIEGGHPLMTRVTGVGCALGATMAALLGAGVAAVNAAAGASALFAAAGERASNVAGSPGPAGPAAATGHAGSPGEAPVGSGTAAWGTTPGPGTFAVHFIDQLASLASAG